STTRSPERRAGTAVARPPSPARRTPGRRPPTSPTISWMTGLEVALDDSTDAAPAFDAGIVFTGALDAPSAAGRSRYLNRELSWLAFNARVLAIAEDPRRPLLERVKFLAIFSDN